MVISHLLLKKMSCPWATPNCPPVRPLSSMRLHQNCDQDLVSSRTGPTRDLALTFLAANDSRLIWTRMNTNSMGTRFQSRLRKKHARDSMPLVHRWVRSCTKFWKNLWQRQWLQLAQQQHLDHLHLHPERQSLARARVCLHSDWPRLRAKHLHPAQHHMVATAISLHRRHMLR